MNRKTRVLVIVDGFGLGGAQMAVADFCIHHDRSRFEVAVCSLGKGLVMADRLAGSVPVRTLGLAKWNPFGRAALNRAVSEFRPQRRYSNI